MEESTSEEKQQFLREKILDKKGIEVNKFVDFLKEKKGEDGEDIDNWTMEDLREVVVEFYKINNISDDNKTNLENDKKQEIVIKENEVIIDQHIKQEIKNEIEIQNNNNINIINTDTNININDEKKSEINNTITESEKKDEVEINDIKDDSNNDININNKIEIKTDIKEEKNEINDSNDNKAEAKDESIKFIIDEDSLMDFMLTEKGLKKKKEENKKLMDSKSNNNEEKKIYNDINTNNNNKNYRNNNIINNNSINSNNTSSQSFNFDKIFKNNNAENGQQKFEFEKVFKNNNIANNIENNQQQFNFEKNFSKDLNDNNNAPKFNFEQNFKNNNQQFDFNKNFKNNLNNNLSDSINSNNFNRIQQINNEDNSKELNENNKDDNNGMNENTTQHSSETNKVEDTYNNEKEINNNNEENCNNSDKNKNNDNENDTTDKVDSNLTNFIDKNDHDNEYGIIIPETIKCKKIENTEFSSHKDIVVKITDPIKVETSFFLGKSVNYLVTTAPFKYAVRRRYSDFVWLREALISLFNTNLIPKITKKGKVTNDKHDDNFIQKRMKILEKFINFLTKDEMIKSSQIFYDFLTIQKDEDFQYRKKVYDKIKIIPINDIRERKSVDGELKISITKEKEIYLENIKDNCIYNTNLFKKLNNNFKLLQDEFSTVIKRFESISEVYRELYGISKNYLDQNTITETYAQMEIMFKKLSESFNTLKIFINTDIREYFKFAMNNFTNISEMIQNIELSKNNYMKLSKSLITKKNDLFKKGDISKWELSSYDNSNSRELLKDKALACNKMLPKETKICINSKEVYGFYLNGLISEFERMRQINAYFHKKKGVHFCQEQIIICSDYTRILGDIIMAIDSCINKK